MTCCEQCDGAMDALADEIVAAAVAAHPGDGEAIAAEAMATVDLILGPAQAPRGRKPWKCSCGIYPDNCDGLGTSCPDYYPGTLAYPRTPREVEDRIDGKRTPYGTSQEA